MDQRRWILGLGLIFGLCSPSLRAGDVPLSTQQLVGGLNRPIFVASPDGDFQRLFIVEQRGVIRIYGLLSQALNSEPFLDIDSEVQGPGGSSDERGLLGLAFDPDYANNGFFYVNFVDNNSDTVVRRYGTNSQDPDLADTTSPSDIISFPQPQSNHNGGWIGFGPDGYLYLATGDGGGQNDPNNRAQTLIDERLGKMLRLDVSVAVPGPAPNYSIPPDNPFVGITGDDEIWAYGLRNPWRASFDAETGDLWIGDVGQFSWEEIDRQPASSAGGENYGWRCMEGETCTGSTGCTCFAVTLTDPVVVYDHGDGCSVTGGYVYRGMAMPLLHGHYFYGDYCTRRTWSFVYDGGVTEFQERTGQLEPAGSPSINALASFGQDAYGELYIVDRATTTGGEIYKIVAADLADVDCNGNLIVDAVEIDLGLASDCNVNGVLDTCDIALGTSEDMDGNGVPDECDAMLFRRGDCNGDGGTNLPDAAFLLVSLFVPGSSAPSCADACDTNDDGSVNVVDAVFVLEYLFDDGLPLPPPFGTCGADPTADAIDCTAYPSLNCP